MRNHIVFALYNYKKEHPLYKVFRYKPRQHVFYARIHINCFNSGVVLIGTILTKKPKLNFKAYGSLY